MDTIKSPYSLIDRVLHKKEKESSRLRKYDAWTIPAEYISVCDKIVYVTEKDTYTISSKLAMEVGLTQTLNNELKIIIPVFYWDLKSAQ